VLCVTAAHEAKRFLPHRLWAFCSFSPTKIQPADETINPWKLFCSLENRRAWVFGVLSLYLGDDFFADEAISNLRFRRRISNPSFAHRVK
jgi:hypothetical protein